MRFIEDVCHPPPPSPRVKFDFWQIFKLGEPQTGYSVRLEQHYCHFKILPSTTAARKRKNTLCLVRLWKRPRKWMKIIFFGKENNATCNRVRVVTIGGEKDRRMERFARRAVDSRAYYHFRIVIKMMHVRYLDWQLLDDGHSSLRH